MEKELTKRVVYELINIKPCPFCDAGIPNIMKVIDNRYIKGEMNWVIECKSMGCIFRRTSPDRDLERLVNEWNTRTP